MHNLVVSCLAVAYLSANVYAIVKMRVFELARSRKHLLLYGVPFMLWGSLILLGCKLMEIMRRFDDGLPDQAFPTEKNRPMHSSSKGFEPALEISPEKRACVDDPINCRLVGKPYLGITSRLPLNRPESMLQARLTEFSRAGEFGFRNESIISRMQENLA